MTHGNRSRVTLPNLQRFCSRQKRENDEMRIRIYESLRLQFGQPHADVQSLIELVNEKGERKARNLIVAARTLHTIQTKLLSLEFFLLEKRDEK
jgi:hypothetical protein